MSEIIELEPLAPMTLKDKTELKFFYMIVKSYAPSYFNLADTPLLEIYAKTLKELDTLYEALDLAGSVADDGNKRYEKISRLIDTKIKCLTRVGASLRINPQQRRAAGTTRQDNPDDVGRVPKSSGRDSITHQDVWTDEKTA